MSAFDRALFAAFALFAAATGAFLLAAPHAFYTHVPGVAESGPFNAHLLRDVGLTYGTLAIGAAFALGHVESARCVTVMAAAYLVGHAGLHAFTEAASANVAAAAAEAPGVYLPAALAVALAVRATTTPSSRSAAKS